MGEAWIRRVPGGVRAAVALYLVEHRGVLTLIDTGSPGRGDRIVKAIRSAGRRPEDVRQIVLTHGHGDHAGSGRAMREQTDATVVAGEPDVETIEGRAPYPLARTRLARAAVAHLTRYPRFTVDRAVAGREELEGGLVAFPTPGHTHGHIAVAAPDLEAVFVGDLVFHLGPLRPPPRAFNQDSERNAESTREVAAMGFRRVVLGHGREISGQRLEDFAARH